MLQRCFKNKNFETEFANSCRLSLDTGQPTNKFNSESVAVFVQCWVRPFGFTCSANRCMMDGCQWGRGKGAEREREREREMMWGLCVWGGGEALRPDRPNVWRVCTMLALSSRLTCTGLRRVASSRRCLCLAPRFVAPRTPQRCHSRSIVQGWGGGGGGGAWFLLHSLKGKSLKTLNHLGRRRRVCKCARTHTHTYVHKHTHTHTHTHTQVTVTVAHTR